MMFFETAN